MQIQYKRKKKNLFAGENRDQGSIFSQEPHRGYWRPRKQKVFFCFLLLRNQKTLTEDEKGSKVIKRKCYVL